MIQVLGFVAALLTWWCRSPAGREADNYDVDGKRVPADSERTVFRAKEVSVDTGVPSLAGHASLAGVEFRDVHAIDRPDLRKAFKSFSQMQRWFMEHAVDAKGSTRSE